MRKIKYILFIIILFLFLSIDIVFADESIGIKVTKNSIKFSESCYSNEQAKYQCRLTDKTYAFEKKADCDAECYKKYTIPKSSEAKKKDFCKTGQGYYFDNCQDVERQCNYNSLGDILAYVNISVYKDAKVAEGNNTGEDILNWGNSFNGISDIKKTYLSNNSCPPFLLLVNGYFYLLNSNNYNDAYSKFSDSATYYLTSETINTGSKNYSTNNSNNNGNNNNSTNNSENSCADFKSPSKCKVGKNSSGQQWGCTWNEEYKFCSPDGLTYISCGSGKNVAFDIPKIIPQLTSYAIAILKTVTPVILIIIGMFQLIKAISSQKEDEMQKAKSSLIKKLIAAFIIFFTVTIVQFVVNQVADGKDEQLSVEDCLKCFLNGDCSGSSYYNDGYGKCYSIKDKKPLNDNGKCPGQK